ncbi:MAG: hypothetical protein HC809_09830, partial [Gammaproteobacteria bacterium]|nr:hypothetical protein [Gammaproteobacteria bacterium]
ASSTSPRPRLSHRARSARRGERSATPARIKSYVVHWLGEMQEVLAYHSAERRHGGAGSVYVLLKKSASARELNRERHGLKSSS